MQLLKYLIFVPSLLYYKTFPTIYLTSHFKLMGMLFFLFPFVFLFLFTIGKLPVPLKLIGMAAFLWEDMQKTGIVVSYFNAFVFS